MFKYISSLLLFTLGFSVNCYGSMGVLTPKVNMAPSDIYTIVATPVEADSAYQLEIFRKENRVAVMTALRPLDGDIVDITISDIDSDGVEELVVLMQEKYTEPKKIHFDVFEFDKNHLNWVENFPHTDNLLALFYSDEVK